MRGVQLFINVEPIADRQPAHHRNSQQKDRYWKLYVEKEVEKFFVIQKKSRLVCRDKSEANDNGIDEAKDGLHSSVVPAEHARVSIA